MQASIDRLEGGGVAILMLLALGAIHGAARADVIGDWNAATQSVLEAERVPGAPHYALVHAAMYDAVIAIRGRFSPLAVQPASAARAASQEAAAATAAHRVLLRVFPRQAPLLDAAYAASMAAVPDGAAKPAGVAIGAEVAAAWLALRTRGGGGVDTSSAFGKVSHQVAAAPVFVKAGGLSLERSRRMAASRLAESRVRDTPSVMSQRYARDFAGGKRTAEETELVRFYAENPTTFFGRNLRALAAAHHFDVATNAELFARVYVTQSDSLLVCGEAGYYACLAVAFAESLRLFFGTQHVSVTLTSSVAGTAPHVFTSTNDVIEEAVDAHGFGSSAPSAATLEDCRSAARQIAREHFRLVSHH